MMTPLKYLFLNAMIILLSINCYAQGIKLKTDQSKYPALDKLLKLKWEYTDKNIGKGKLLIKNGLIFPVGAYNYCLDGETGSKIEFSNENSKALISKSIPDSILLVYNNHRQRKLSINILKGIEITSGSLELINTNHRDSKFLIDTIYYYPVSEKLIMAKDLNRPRRVLWEYPTDYNIIYKYIKYDSLFVVFTEQQLLLLDAKKGTKEWETKIEQLTCDPVLIGDEFYFITKGKDETNTLYSFNLHKREKNWSIKFQRTSGYYGLAVDNGKVCFISGKGVDILDAGSGKEQFLVEGDYEETVVSIIDNYILVYDTGKESISIGTAIGLNSGKIEYQYFTSEGFPPLGEEDMSETAKEMREKGEADWKEGLGYNYLDGNDIYFTKDPSTGLIYGSTWDIVYCLEYVK